MKRYSAPSSTGAINAMDGIRNHGLALKRILVFAMEVAFINYGSMFLTTVEGQDHWPNEGTLLIPSYPLCNFLIRVS